LEEQQLLEALQRGDRNAQRVFYEQMAGHLMSVCLRYVPNRDDARDVLQDSLLKMFTSVGRFEYRGKGSLRAWVTRIVANEAVSHLRMQLKTVEWEGQLPDDVPDVSEEDEPRRVPPDVLMQMLGRLPTGYRTVLNMFVFEQMPHKEIARVLGIKENTSASQYLRAKKQLGQMIKAYLKKN
jgi:RNA polymerase sigma-70 factor (ECF subfamily)